METEGIKPSTGTLQVFLAPLGTCAPIEKLVPGENFEISTYWLKASYSASELHPHLPFVLLTHYLLYLNGIGGHTTVYRYSYVGLTFTQGLTSAKQMVLRTRIELVLSG